MSAEKGLIRLWSGDAPYADKSPDQNPPTLKPFEAEGAKVAVVVCPGGAYFFKADHEGDPIAERLRAGGVSGYVLDYRVRPCHPLAPLADALRAIRAVRAMGYRYVGILGFSAGGNLICNAATHWDDGDPASEDPLERLSSRPDFFVPCYPVVSFTQFPHLGSVENLLGEAVDDHAQRRYFSAELNVNAQTPPTFIWHTANDGAVPVENSLLLAGALSRAGVCFELHVYPDGPHGIGLGEDNPEARNWPEECLRFIRRVCPL